MTEIERFRGWPIKQLLLPDNERIICLYCKDGTEPERSVDDANHNLFRLDAQGKVLWQVTRDEQGKLDWDLEHKDAQEDGFDGCRLPFIALTLIYPDETETSTTIEVKTLIWEQGCAIKAHTLDGWYYQLDKDSGIALNITPVPHRPW